jgi:two-component system CheB/CheR fusion protein
VEWDARAREIFGLPGTGRLTLDQAQSVIHPDDRALADAVVAEALEPGAPGHYAVQKRIIRADGVRWVRTIGHIEYADEADGPVPVKLMGIVEDITEAGGTPFESAIAGSDIILAHCDRELRYTWLYNPDPHFDAERVIGRRDDELSAPECVAELVALKQYVLDEAEDVTRIVEIVVEGEPQSYRIHAAPLKGSEDEVVGVATAATRVTEEVRSERSAREASQAKSRLMSLVSHELRTPLAAILGHADLLEQGVPAAIPEDALAHVRRIQQGVEHMQGLIDELLTFARLEAGREQPELAVVDPADLAREAIGLVDGAAREKGLDLRLGIEADLPRLRTDPPRAVQVLVNLLGNAIKYTAEGAVSLRVEAGDDCRFEVVDTGIGIAEEHLDKVFEPFWRAPGSEDTGGRGTGLGLALARQTARLLDGDIEVASRVGEGSRFTLRLPTP